MDPTSNPASSAPAFVAVQARMPRRILRLETVSARTTLPKSTIYLLISRGEFPAPKQLTPSGAAVGWDEAEIEQWVAGLPTASPEGAKRWQPPVDEAPAPPVAEKPRTLSKHGRIVGRPRKTDGPAGESTQA